MVATKGTRISRDCAAKPMATSELDSAMTERVARMLALLTVALAPTWSTDCSVPNTARNASVGGRLEERRAYGEGNATRESHVARDGTPGPSAGVPPPVVACVHPPIPAWEGYP